MLANEVKINLGGSVTLIFSKEVEIYFKTFSITAIKINKRSYFI